MSVRISFLRRLLDVIMPRLCVMCGRRLGITDECICACCNLHLPRTRYWRDAYDNKLARCFWVQMPIEKAAALFFYHPHSPSSTIIYSLKYGHNDEIGYVMGKMLARELIDTPFFSDIDIIVPMPITRRRQRERGYNQSMEIAKGVSAMSGIRIARHAVERKTFTESQTRKDRWQRLSNVENAFRLRDDSLIRGRHVLIIDDVVTTGATIIELSKALQQGGARTFSVLALGFTQKF